MVEELSAREKEVLDLAAQGLTDKAIANEIGISPTTVVTYWARIRSKMGAVSRAELVANSVRRQALSELDTLRNELQQRIALESTLKQDLAMLQGLLDSAPEAIIIVDPEGVVVSGNSRACELLECPKSAFGQIRVGKFIPGEFHAAHRNHREEFFKNPERITMGPADGVDVVTYEGRKIRCVLTLNIASVAGEKAAVVILRAVS
ncbi:MAG: LuxR C-terminal-related transcriptional regulator [Fimbriimonadaceae bacterium]